MRQKNKELDNGLVGTRCYRFYDVTRSDAMKISASDTKENLIAYCAVANWVSWGWETKVRTCLDVSKLWHLNGVSGRSYAGTESFWRPI